MCFSSYPLLQAPVSTPTTQTTTRTSPLAAFSHPVILPAGGAVLYTACSNGSTNYTEVCDNFLFVLKREPSRVMAFFHDGVWGGEERERWNWERDWLGGRHEDDPGHQLTFSLCFADRTESIINNILWFLQKKKKRETL